MEKRGNLLEGLYPAAKSHFEGLRVEQALIGAEAGIVSEGVAQVIDDLGNPRTSPGNAAEVNSLVSVALRTEQRLVVVLPNTCLTLGSNAPGSPPLVGRRMP